MVSKTPVFDSTQTQAHFNPENLNERVITLNLKDGREVYIPSELFQKQDDNTYRLPFAFANIDEQGHIVIPVYEETVRLGKKLVETGQTEITKTVQHHEETLEDVLHHDDVTIERIEVDTFVEEAEGVHYDGDALIIPLYEEVFVVEKRLRLKEKVRIKRITEYETVSETVTRREENITINRNE